MNMHSMAEPLPTSLTSKRPYKGSGQKVFTFG